ncbi:MAG: hypothetical protein ACO3LE_05065 [Bdellovibrionota bacterium]
MRFYLFNFIALIMLASCSPVEQGRSFRPTGDFNTIAPVGFILHSNEFNSITRTPLITWSPSASSDVLYYEYSIGSSAGETDVLGWRSNDLVTSLQVSGLSLEKNQTYFINIRAVGPNSKTSAVTSSSGWRATYDWRQRADIKASNAEQEDFFASSVAIHGDTLVVGAEHEGSSQNWITNGGNASNNNASPGSGAAYVYIRENDEWRQQAYLKASNSEPNDRFGSTVAIYEDTIVVGAPGEDSSQNVITNGSTASNNNASPNSGAAYVFVRNASGQWSQQAYLKVSNSSQDDAVGSKLTSSISIYEDTIVIGNSLEDHSSRSITPGRMTNNDGLAGNSGAVYVFQRSNNQWSQQAYIKASNADAGDLFGSSVSLIKDSLVVGADGESSNQNFISQGQNASSDNSALDSGAAYVFERSGSQWSQQAYLKASNSDADDLFGEKVAIDGDVILISSPIEKSSQNFCSQDNEASDDNSLHTAGAGYVFVRQNNQWVQKAYLKASNADLGDALSDVIALAGETVVLGTMFEKSGERGISHGESASSDNSSNLAGAVYVYTP